MKEEESMKEERRIFMTDNWNQRKKGRDKQAHKGKKEKK